MAQSVNGLSTLPPVSIPTAPRRPGTCRICGCTDGNACVLEGNPALVTGMVRGALIIGTERVATCEWIELDLCSRCHSPRRPTRGQDAEISRIRSRLGPVHVEHGPMAGTLTITLAGDPPATSAAAALGELDSRLLIARIARGDWWPGRRLVIGRNGQPIGKPKR